MRQWIDLIAVLVLLAAVPLMSGCPSQSGRGVEKLAPEAEKGNATANATSTEAKDAVPPLVELVPDVEPSSTGSDVQTVSAVAAVTDPAIGAGAVLDGGDIETTETIGARQMAHKIPQVQMTDEHQAQLYYKVGDVFPQTVLLNLAGEETPLTNYWGSKATVILFWSVQDPYAFESYRSLPGDVPSAAKGKVGVLSINCGDAPQAIVTKVPGDTPPVLLASPKSAEMPLHLGAKLPQIYVLDSKGRVVWCDIEYSRVARDRMAEAVHYLLSNE